MTTPPQAVDVATDELWVTWTDDHIGRFDLVSLRRACSCAMCTEMREQGEEVWPRPGAPGVLRLEGAELMGAWGLNLRWNDGHETGVYEWDVLRSSCRCPLCAP